MHPFAFVTPLTCPAAIVGMLAKIIKEAAICEFMSR